MNRNIPISTIMTESTITVRPNDSLLTIQSIFDRNNIHHIPVLKEDHTLVGIISKTDLLVFRKKLSLQTSGKHYSQFTEANTTAKNIMTTDLTVLDPDDSIGLAADIFLANTFHAIPVVEDKKLVGIITNHDLLQYAFKDVV